MINPKMFTVEGLLKVMLDDHCGNACAWRRRATIVPGYMPPHPDANTRPRCVVRCAGEFLRHSAGPCQGYFWDFYGDDFQTPELALAALLQAPVPPALLDPSRLRERKDPAP